MRYRIAIATTLMLGVVASPALAFEGAPKFLKKQTKFYQAQEVLHKKARQMPSIHAGRDERLHGRPKDGKVVHLRVKKQAISIYRQLNPEFDRAYQIRQLVARSMALPYSEGYSSERGTINWMIVDLYFGGGQTADCAHAVLGQESGHDHLKRYGGATGPWHIYDGVAYGIPQANPGSKMLNQYPDADKNPLSQVKWFDGYSSARYGGVCGAAAYKSNAGVY